MYLAECTVLLTKLQCISRYPYDVLKFHTKQDWKDQIDWQSKISHKAIENFDKITALLLKIWTKIRFRISVRHPVFLTDWMDNNFTGCRDRGTVLIEIGK